jgi:hypothetical protein
MDEFADRLQFGVASDFLLEPVFHRLHIVVGDALDVLDPLGVGDAEIFNPIAQNVGRLFTEQRDFENAGIAGQGLQPADFDLNPMADQAVFAENRAQISGLVGIAAINGSNGGKSGQFHGESGKAK